MSYRVPQEKSQLSITSSWLFLWTIRRDETSLLLEAQSHSAANPPTLVSTRRCCCKCWQHQRDGAGSLGFPLVSDRCFSQAPQAQSEFAAPAPFSYWSPFNQYLVPISPKFLILISIFPATVTPHQIHVAYYFQFSFPTATTTALLCYLILPHSLQTQPFPSLCCPGLIHVESSSKRTCLSFYPKTTVLSQAKSYRAAPVLRIPVLRDGRLFTKYLQIDLLGLGSPDLWGWHPVMQLSFSDVKYPLQSTQCKYRQSKFLHNFIHNIQTALADYSQNLYLKWARRKKFWVWARAQPTEFFWGRQATLIIHNVSNSTYELGIQHVLSFTNSELYKRLQRLTWWKARTRQDLSLDIIKALIYFRHHCLIFALPNYQICSQLFKNEVWKPEMSFQRHWGVNKST